MSGDSNSVIGALPPAQWLKTFLAVLRAGSFSEAAEHLHMTQAAVSRHVRLLEHRLGAALFERHARGVAPTALAEAMLPRVAEAFRLLEIATVEASGRPTVHLRCDISWAEAVLSRHLHEFATGLPEIRLQVSTFVWPETSPPFEADLYVMIGVGELPGFERLELTTEVSWVVASPIVARRFESRPESVAWFTRIGQEPAWRRWAAMQADGYCGSNTIVCDSSIITRAAALAGQGLAMLRASQCETDIAEKRLVRVDGFVESVPEAYCLYRRRGAHRSDTVGRVTDWLKSISAASLDVSASGQTGRL